MSRATAALAAAALAVAGCTTTVSGQARPIDEAKAAGVTMPAPAAVAEQDWVDVSGRVEVAKDSEGAQFGAVALPGIGIGFRDGTGAPNLCTLGPAVRRVGRGEAGFLTAGHCTANLEPTKQYLSATADVSTSPQIELGTATQAVDDDTGIDSAVIWTGSVDPRVTKIAGAFLIVGVMPEAQVKVLPRGTPVCIDGAHSGVVCSGLVKIADPSMIRFGDRSVGGDSGAAVFVVDRSNRATLIGIYKGLDPVGNGEATLLAPALDRLGAEAVTSN